MRSKGISFGIVFLVTLLLSACTKDESLLTSEEASSGLKNAQSGYYVPGSDITLQLRADLSASLDVILPEGHFYISESIIIQAYCGTIKGAGKDLTILEAAQGFRATEDPFFPVPGITFTEILAYEWSKGDITIKDLSILVRGDAPCEPHVNLFHGETTTIDNAIVAAGVHDDANDGITVTIKNVRIEGEESSDPLALNGKNLAYPIVVGGLGSNKPVSAIVKDCEIRNGGYLGIEHIDAFGGDVDFKNNVIANCMAGIWTASITDPLNVLGTLSIKGNTITGTPWYAISNLNTWSSYCIKDNTLDGEPLEDDCQE